jgi:hypothetical protein
MTTDTLEAIQAGGTTQWIRIRGADTSNPVLLLIQQGPGLPMINEARRFEHLLGLEQAFTVIHWDQRGCGRSLRRREDRAAISLEAVTGDTMSLLNYLRNRFGAKTYVAGFSFGATIGAYRQGAPMSYLRQARHHHPRRTGRTGDVTGPDRQMTPMTVCGFLCRHPQQGRTKSHHAE